MLKNGHMRKVAWLALFLVCAAGAYFFFSRRSQEPKPTPNTQENVPDELGSEEISPPMSEGTPFDSTPSPRHEKNPSQPPTSPPPGNQLPTTPPEYQPPAYQPPAYQPQYETPPPPAQNWPESEPNFENPPPPVYEPAPSDEDGLPASPPPPPPPPIDEEF